LTLKQELVAGRDEKSAYQVHRDMFKNEFNFDGYDKYFVIIFMGMVITCYQLNRYLALKSGPVIGDTENTLVDPVDRRCPFCEKLTPSSDPDCVWCHQAIGFDSKPTATEP